MVPAVSAIVATILHFAVCRGIEQLLDAHRCAELTARPGVRILGGMPETNSVGRGEAQFTDRRADELSLLGGDLRLFLRIKYENGAERRGGRRCRCRGGF